MDDLMGLETVRAQLNPLLKELPPQERQIARELIAAQFKVDRRTASLDSELGEERALLRKVGKGYVALREADCDLIKSLVSACKNLVMKGPSLGVVGELVALLFAIRCHGIELSVSQGLVLAVLRRREEPLSVQQIGDALAETGVALTDDEVTEGLGGLARLLNAPGKDETIRCVEGKWRATGV